MQKQLKIAHIAAEVEPFSKSGGLANVIGSLPRAHQDLGHEVIVVTPYYENVINLNGQKLELIAENDQIELTPGFFQDVSYLKGKLPDSNVSVYFIASRKYFGERNTLYGAINDNARFMFFNVAALHLLKKINWIPDIIQCHDWHTGLIPYFIKGRYKKEGFLNNVSTLFTIHNLAYQFGHDWWSVPESERDDGRSPLPSFEDIDKIEKINFAKRAILNADAINTVSETYREEILTKESGQELERVLKNREKRVFGIVNGISYEDYNPLTDPGLKKHYSDKSVSRKKVNKLWLQRYFKLKVNTHTPLLCMTSRIAEQKGFGLLTGIINHLMKLDVQMIVMGDGDPEISRILQNVQKEYPKQFAFVPFDSKIETSLYAGSDIFVLPSRFEPCGINQMIALRYGCIPIVHHIGGLADTITDFNPTKQTGNGYTFTSYSPEDLLIAIVRALETYKYKETWKELTISGLRQANSWILPAQKYIDLYKTTIKFKKASDRKTTVTHHKVTS
jgi:starch synthase